MFKSSCIGAKVNDSGLFHFTAVINTSSVPGHIINGHTRTRQAIRDFIFGFLEADSAIVVNPAPTFHPEQGFNIS